MLKDAVPFVIVSRQGSPLTAVAQTYNTEVTEINYSN
jgi:hypothetical protein